jgi:hypothetical protein
MKEAAWFGKVLQTRPALLEHVSPNVVEIISDSWTDDANLRGRDPESFEEHPLDFFR